MRNKLSTIKGVGEKTEKLFQKLDIYNVQDLLEYYPRGYDIYESPVTVDDVVEGKTMAVEGVIAGNVLVSGSPNMKVVTLHLKGTEKLLKVVWFRMAFLKSTLHSGQQIILRGRIKSKNNQMLLEQPEIYQNRDQYDNKLGTLQPIYALTKGITNNLITRTISAILNSNEIELKECLPQYIVEKYQLCSYKEAVYGMHFPVNKDLFVQARKRIVFEEFISFIVSLQAMKMDEKKVVNQCSFLHSKEVSEFIKKLPYALTDAQKKVWNEIQLDTQNEYKVMSRLIQGDVGSGKTVLALLTLMEAVYNGYQGAMMAPTEVLARQHYSSITEMFEEYGIPIKVVLLTGSMKAKEKREANVAIEAGEAQIIIGTHALIQEKVNYNNLAVVVTDEQHRFGVRQREQFANKGMEPHILVMSATPIPRTLAIILYGDLDISVVDELPANRLPIKNCVVDTNYRPKAYEFISNQVKEGRQGYVICPMVEESEHLEGENVIDYASSLQVALGNEIRVTYLHGKMKQTQKDDIMNRYYNHEIDVLVSTTVIEVGINVPNASVMLIENSERFGLSALHQLRGRVGRGVHQSYCIFMTASKSKITKERLNILGKSNDGFKVANEDLRLRGPGDLFGIRQSGLMNFKVADVYQDAKLLQLASEAVVKMDVKDKEAILKKQGERFEVIL